MKWQEDEASLHYWFEQDIARLARHAGSEALLSLASGPEDRCHAEYEQALQNKQPDAAAAVLIAAIYALWEEGRAFRRLDPWLQRANELCAHPCALSPLATAAVQVHSMYGALLRYARLDELRLRLPIISSAVEASHSDALRLTLAATSGYLHLMAGELQAAELRLADACHFSRTHVADLAGKVHVESLLGLIEGIKGQPKQGAERLQTLLSQPSAASLPPAVRLISTCHLLYCQAHCGPPAELDQEIEAVRSTIVPGNKAYHRSYMHFALGAAELARGNPGRALTHADLSAELGRVSESVEAEFFPALLRGQALGDLGYHEESIAQFKQWLPKWQACGFKLPAIAAWAEIANLELRLGRLTAARDAFDQATRLTPATDPLPSFNRPPGHLDALRARLQASSNDVRTTLIASPPPRIQIRMFGELQVQCDEQVLYDRNWRGSKAKTLLKSLVTLGGYKVSTQKLADLMWPDADGAQGLQNLKVALWRLRRLGCEDGARPLPWLVVKHGHVSIVSALCQVDAIQFLKTSPYAQPEEITQALDSYVNDFLVSDDSETWIIEHRLRAQQHYVRLAQALAERRPADAYLERAIELDSTNERSYELLMASQLRQGREAQAMATYHRAEIELAKKLGCAPSSTLRALVKKIQEPSK